MRSSGNHHLNTLGLTQLHLANSLSHNRLYCILIWDTLELRNHDQACHTTAIHKGFVNYNRECYAPCAWAWRNVLQVRSAGVTTQALSLTAPGVEQLDVEEVKTSAPPAPGLARRMGWHIETALYVLRMIAAC